uniref:Multifunctional conjugation protein TraI n=1 Tax=Klebsiella pneumoniae TaxID=573 RepID=A0A2P1BN62_KLEPN|nr:Multifunctional conjugation protein TraI [Klebsiella pneumoniae]
MGKHGMWEMKGSLWNRSPPGLRRSGGRRARCLLKSRDVAALDTRKSKEAIDPAEKMVEWMNTLKETGFDIRGTVRPPMREPQSWPVHLPRR